MSLIKINTMSRHKVITALSMLFVLVSALPLTAQSDELFSEASLWEIAFYDDYDHTNFLDFDAFQAEIDMDNIDYPLLHAAIFFETNKRRVAQGGTPFLHSVELELAAYDHSLDMVEFNFFSHSNPQAGKRGSRDRIYRQGIQPGWTGENIRIGFGIQMTPGRSVYTPPQNGGYFSYEYQGEPIPNHTYYSFAVQSLNRWMNSPGHRRNILKAEYTHLGVGAAHFNDPGFYGMDKFKATQNFSSDPYR
jgi:uncharacterized protein YkwD